jgi:hypothetical protein
MVILKTFLSPLQDCAEGSVGRSPERNTGIIERGRRRERAQGRK